MIALPNPTYKPPGPEQGPTPSDEYYKNLPHVGELTYAQAWEESGLNGLHAGRLHKAACRKLEAEGKSPLFEAWPSIKHEAVIQRQEALGRWHEFYESHEQMNKAFGYPEGHPKA